MHDHVISFVKLLGLPKTKSDDDDTFAGFKKKGQKVVFSDDDDDDDNFSTPKPSTSKGRSTFLAFADDYVSKVACDFCQLFRGIYS